MTTSRDDPGPPASAAWHRAFLHAQLFVGAIAALCALGAACGLASVNLGFEQSVSADGRRWVVFVDPGGGAERAGMKVGDAILADPGGVWPARWTEREDYHTSFALARAIARGAARYAIERGGDRLELDVSPGPPSAHTLARRIRSNAAYYVLASVYLAMAALLARRPRRDDPARRLAIHGLAVVAPAFAFNGSSEGWPAWLIALSAVCVNAGTTTCATLLTRFAFELSAAIARRRARVANRDRGPRRRAATG